jgi:hypothetical protein
LALNDNETSILTQVGGGAFTLNSFWFEFLGSATNNTLLLTLSSGAMLLFDAATYGTNDGGQTFSTLITDIISIALSTGAGGNVRIDDINVAPIPLPGSLGLLIAGMAPAPVEDFPLASPSTSSSVGPFILGRWGAVPSSGFTTPAVRSSVKSRSSNPGVSLPFGWHHAVLDCPDVE